MNDYAHTDWQNLDTRTNDGITVALDFRRDTITLDAEVRVTVDNEGAGENFTLYPRNDLALDCFRHPYAYAHGSLMSGRMERIAS